MSTLSTQNEIKNQNEIIIRLFQNVLQLPYLKFSDPLPETYLFLFGLVSFGTLLCGLRLFLEALSEVLGNWVPPERPISLSLIPRCVGVDTIKRSQEISVISINVFLWKKECKVQLFCWR